MSQASADALAHALVDLVGDREPETAHDYLQRVTAALALEAETRTLLASAVSTARSAGVTWAAIGATLGMSKQAAQKRFAPTEMPAAADDSERILGPVGVFDEMRELALAGQYGWHSVEFGTFYHRVVRSDRQWEHQRVSRAAAVRRLEAEGWQVIGGPFPYTYLKRQLDTPALGEPVSYRDTSSTRRG